MRDNLSDICRELCIFSWDRSVLAESVNGWGVAGILLGLSASINQSDWMAVATRPLGSGSTVPG